uniref:Uncharacterized protein n=1 Tax=Octopus bimaculoides TaxID=37653 RepID=A0A0L8HDL6_OCTBM
MSILLKIFFCLLRIKQIHRLIVFLSDVIIARLYYRLLVLSSNGHLLVLSSACIIVCLYYRLVPCLVYLVVLYILSSVILSLM